VKSDSDVSDPPFPVIPTEAKRSGGFPLLEETIRHEIKTCGPVTFARYMELALYHPEHGYYASGRARIGRKGDFFTNVSVGPVFGKLLAAQFLEVWEKLDRPHPFNIVEQGAHDGQLAADVLGALRGSDCFAAVHYVIVEPFPIWRERQQETLGDFAHVIPSKAEGSRGDTLNLASRAPSTSLRMTGFQRNKISWVESINQLEPFTGIHFSNELFDALPVQLFAPDGDNWKEMLVSFVAERFCLRRDAASARPKSPDPSEFGTCASTSLREVCFAAPELMRQIAAKLSRGLILTIDYGLTGDELASPARAGTLQVRRQHRKLSSPFQHIGDADISAHVDWASLIEAGKSAGAQLLGLTDQHHFLTAILSELIDPTNFSAPDKCALQTLLHPEMLGRSFQALALGKDFVGPLGGFRFSRL
jgi:SAM-dependent MidA family methyltransferase